jgi:hypothetical protein
MVSDGTKGTIPVAAITGTAWNATIGKLAADTSVTIDFQFTGLLDSSLQQTVVSEMFADPAYRAAVSQFVRAAQGKASTAQMAAATLLAQVATEVLISVLARKGLTPKNPADLKTSLSAVLTGSSSLAVGNDQQSDEVSDLKKYAGFDVGALYAYRLSELRTFAMVHDASGTGLVVVTAANSGQSIRRILNVDKQPGDKGTAA